MAKKLLNKSTLYLLGFSVVLLVISAPVLYFMTESLYLEETDETLELHKQEFLQDNPNFRTADIALWNAYNRNVKIVAFNGKNRDTLFTQTYYDALEDENEPYRELNAPVKIEGKLYTYRERNNLIEQEDMVVAVAALFCSVIFILLAGILVINKFSSKRLWKPFYKTLDEMEDFELDKSRRPQFPPTGIQEFDRLNNSVNHLIGKNQAIFATQKEFVENAAHELQTPLALFQGKIENLFQTNGLSEEQSKLLEALNNDVARLHRLNKNLLLLSKLENGSYLEKQPVSIAEILKRNLGFFSEQAQSRNIHLHVEFADGFEVNANPILTEVLLNNLLLNAIRHNVNGGEIAVTVTEKSVVFANTGPNAALDPERVFNRFSKLGPSSQGNGLGLAIVKKILELNGWSIAYEFADDWHIFKVSAA